MAAIEIPVASRSSIHRAARSATPVPAPPGCDSPPRNGDWEPRRGSTRARRDVLAATSRPANSSTTIENGAAFARTWDPVQSPEDRDLEERIFPSGDLVFALWRAKASGKQGTRLDSLAISVFELRAERVVRLRMFHFDTAEIVRFFEMQRLPPLAGSPHRPDR
jgi:ketosteroid isomerase-like protein